MKKQSGFAIIELVIVLVIVAAVAGVGYYVWRTHKTTPTPTATTTGSTNYQSPSTSTPTAPQVNSASDLNNAMTALNQTSITANNTDSSQLSTQASGF
jgi:prepilin-type N-terminal cleavage/methylation domain-containing protein